MGWPQITMIVILSLLVLGGAVMHGRPRTGRNSFWIALVSAGGEALILYQGGFFS